MKSNMPVQFLAFPSFEAPGFHDVVGTDATHEQVFDATLRCTCGKRGCAHADAVEQVIRPTCACGTRLLPSEITLCNTAGVTPACHPCRRKSRSTYVSSAQVAADRALWD